MSRYTLQDVAIQNGINGARIWIVIHDFVYDVTDYRTKHPGGAELFDEYAGKDATAAFEDFGHSSDAKQIMKNYLIGELVDADKRGNRKKTKQNGISIENATYRRRKFLAILLGKCAA